MIDLQCPLLVSGVHLDSIWWLASLRATWLLPVALGTALRVAQKALHGRLVSLLTLSHVVLYHIRILVLCHQSPFCPPMHPLILSCRRALAYAVCTAWNVLLITLFTLCPSHGTGTP